MLHTVVEKKWNFSFLNWFRQLGKWQMQFEKWRIRLQKPKRPGLTSGLVNTSEDGPIGDEDSSSFQLYWTENVAVANGRVRSLASLSHGYRNRSKRKKLAQQSNLTSEFPFRMLSKSSNSNHVPGLVGLLSPSPRHPDQQKPKSYQSTAILLLHSDTYLSA